MKLIPLFMKQWGRRYLIHPFTKIDKGDGFILLYGGWWKGYKISTYKELLKIAREKYSYGINNDSIKLINSLRKKPRNLKCHQCKKYTIKHHLILQNPNWGLSHIECFWHFNSLCNLKHYSLEKKNVTLNNNDLYLCDACITNYLIIGATRILQSLQKVK
ncbi:MAG: hypothetical protein AABY22_34940 [Nanoarchaeota archaeon]